MNMKKMEQAGELQLWDLAAEFQQALIEVLVEKSLQAARQYEVKSVLMAGSSRQSTIEVFDGRESPITKYKSFLSFIRALHR